MLMAAAQTLRNLNRESRDVPPSSPFAQRLTKFFRSGLWL